MSRKHIVTVTLNAAIDKTYFVAAITPGVANRVRRIIAQPGGKGINVARVAHLLGEPVIAAGVVGGSNGEYIEHALTRQGIRHAFVQAAGESRICLNVIPDTGRSVELLEPGIDIGQDTIDSLMRKLEQWAENASVIVLSGSLPAGVTTDLYRDIIEALAPYRVPVILDTSGTALERGMTASPYMMKPNQEEMSQLTGVGSIPPTDGDNPSRTGTISPADEDEEPLISSIADLVRKGIGCVALSLGDRGSLIGIRDTVYRVSAVPIQPVNVVGCGDAFVAGAAVGMQRGWPATDIFKLAAACGASNALHSSAGMIDPKQVGEFADTIRVETIASI